MDGLNDGKHGIEIVNYAGLLLDLAVVQIDLGAQRYVTFSLLVIPPLAVSPLSPEPDA